MISWTSFHLADMCANCSLLQRARPNWCCSRYSFAWFLTVKSLLFLDFCLIVIVIFFCFLNRSRQWSWARSVTQHVWWVRNGNLICSDYPRWLASIITHISLRKLAIFIPTGFFISCLFQCRLKNFTPPNYHSFKKWASLTFKKTSGLCEPLPETSMPLLSDF